MTGQGMLMLQEQQWGWLNTRHCYPEAGTHALYQISEENINGWVFQTVQAIQMRTPLRWYGRTSARPMCHKNFCSTVLCFRPQSSVVSEPIPPLALLPITPHCQIQAIVSALHLVLSAAELHRIRDLPSVHCARSVSDCAASDVTQDPEECVHCSHR